MAKANVTREQWLEEGLTRIGRHGLEGLKVEQMAKALGSSKAGFYWYFKSRDEFIDALLGHWHEQETRTAIQLAGTEAEPLARLHALFMAATKIKIYRDVLFQIRKVAATHRGYAKLLEQVENERIRFVTGIFRELGFPEERAELMGQFLYSFYLGWYERIKDKKITREEMTRQFEGIKALFGLSQP